MAKYVGKIFYIKNRLLGLRGDGSHYVDIQWYDQKNKTFYGKVITSLEEEKELIGENRKELGKTPFVGIVNKRNTFKLFKKNKYSLLRNGDIDPIPVDDMEGFDNWGGYYKGVKLSKNDLDRSRFEEGKSIKRKKRR